jgi:hypothetical protein
LKKVDLWNKLMVNDVPRFQYETGWQIISQRNQCSENRT